MAIPLELLKLTESKAPITLTYGGPGLHKTLAEATLVAPGLSLNWEQRAGSIIPWTRATRRWDERQWRMLTQEDRQLAFDLIDPVLKKISPFKAPAPYVDIIFFDPTDPGSFDEHTRVVAEFDAARYNSLSLDSAHEFSLGVQTYSKRVNSRGKWDGANLTERQQMLDNPIEGKAWQGPQERVAMALKRIKSFSAQGVFVYITCGQEIDKDYVNPPIGATRDSGTQGERPYNQKGSVWLNGKLVNVATHGVDLLLRAKAFKRQVDNDIISSAIWVSVPEPLEGGSGVYWDAKDTFGRLPDNVAPNFQVICKHLYGAAGAAAIYKAAHVKEAGA